MDGPATLVAKVACLLPMDQSVGNRHDALFSAITRHLLPKQANGNQL